MYNHWDIVDVFLYSYETCLIQGVHNDCSLIRARTTSYSGFSRNAKRKHMYCNLQEWSICNPSGQFHYFIPIRLPKCPLGDKAIFRWTKLKIFLIGQDTKNNSVYVLTIHIVLLSVLVWSVCYFAFFDSRILITSTPFASSNSFWLDLFLWKAGKTVHSDL